MRLQEWVNDNICFIEEENYWAAIGCIAGSSMGYGRKCNKKMLEELRNYYKSKNDFVLSDETINFIKEEAANVFFQFK